MILTTKLFNEGTYRFERISQDRLKEVAGSIRLWNEKNPNINVHDLEERPKYYGCYLNPLNAITQAPSYIVDFVESYGWEEPRIGNFPLRLGDVNSFEKEEEKRIEEFLARVTEEEKKVYEAKHHIGYIDVVPLNTNVYYCNLSENDKEFLQSDRKFSFDEVYNTTVGRIRGSRRSKVVKENHRKEYLFRLYNTLLNLRGQFVTYARARGYRFYELEQKGAFKNGEYACFITIDTNWSLLDIPTFYKETIRNGLLDLNVVKFVDDKDSVANLTYSSKYIELAKEKRLLVNGTNMMNMIDVLQSFAKDYIEEKNKKSTKKITEQDLLDKEFFELNIKPLFEIPTHYLLSHQASIIKSHFESFLADLLTDQAEKYKKYKDKTNQRNSNFCESLLNRRNGMRRLCRSIERKYKEVYDFDVNVQRIVDLMVFAHNHAGYAPKDRALILNKIIQRQLFVSSIYALHKEGLLPGATRKELDEIKKLSSVDEFQVYLNKSIEKGFDPRLITLRAGIIDHFRLKVRQDCKGLSSRAYTKFCSEKKGETVEEGWEICRHSIPEEVINRNPQRYSVMIHEDGSKSIFENLKYNERDVKAKGILGTNTVSEWDANAAVHRIAYNLKNGKTLSHRVDFYSDVFQPKLKKRLIKNKGFKQLASEVGMTVEELFNSLDLTREEIKSIVNPSAFCRSVGKFKMHLISRLDLQRRVLSDWKRFCEILAREVWDLRDELCGDLRGGVLFFFESFVMSYMKMRVYEKYGMHSLLTYDCIHSNSKITDDLYEQLFDEACQQLMIVFGIDEEGQLYVKDFSYKDLKAFSQETEDKLMGLF